DRPRPRTGAARRPARAAARTRARRGGRRLADRALRKAASDGARAGRRRRGARRRSAKKGITFPMRLVRLGLANVNSTAGAVAERAERAVAHSRDLAADGVNRGALPEQVLGGYPPEDLVLWPDFVAAQRRSLVELAEQSAALPSALVVGLLVAAFDQVY